MGSQIDGSFKVWTCGEKVFIHFDEYKNWAEKEVCEKKTQFQEIVFSTADECKEWMQSRIDAEEIKLNKKKIYDLKNAINEQEAETAKIKAETAKINTETAKIKAETAKFCAKNLEWYKKFGFRHGRMNLEKENPFWDVISNELKIAQVEDNRNFLREILQAYEQGYDAGHLAYQNSFRKKIEDLLEPFFERIYNQLVTVDKLLTKYHIFINAHYYFFISVILLGIALLLQNGGNWQQMASLNSPITIPGFDPIPFTASISFPFALLGWIENSAGSALSFASAASTNEILALFASAAVLFFFASNRIQLSAVGVRPEFALLAFTLFWVSVLFDVALHWHSAPVLPPVLILFNRAFAVLALCVSLFWRNAAKRGEDVPGADGEYRKACDAAEQTARKIGLWLLALVWLATQLSHANISPVAFYWIKAAMIGVFVAIPLRLMIQFKSDFQKALGRYNQLLALWQQSYKPPPTVATDAQVRDALNGGRGIGGKDWNDTGE